MIKNLLKVTVSMAIMAMGAQVSAQNVLHVDAAATGNNDGSSWTNAYTSLHTALGKADTAMSIDTILIASGTYKPEVNLPGYPDTRSKSFTVKRSNLAIIGGYDATTGNRDLVNFPTILSAETGDTSIVTDNYRIIFYLSGSATDTIKNVTLDGFVFEKAYNDLNSGAYYYNGLTQGRNQSGSAIFAGKAFVTVNNCQFNNNQSLWVGGSVSVFNGAMDITNCTFTNSKSSFGGAIVTIEPFGAMNIDNCTFDNNKCNYYGDAIYYESAGSYIYNINNSTFINHNVTSSILYAASTILNFNNNKVFNNTANYNPLIDLGTYNAVTTNFSYNEIYDNTVSNAELIRLLYSNSNVFVANNVFARNKSNYVINNYYSNPNVHFSNNTVADNVTFTVFGGDSTIIKNSVIANNTITNPINFANLNISNSYVQGYNNNLNGNINTTLVDPMFNTVDTAYNVMNYSLQFCSPLLNVGDTTGNTLTEDFLGNNRVVGASIDMGAIEKLSDVTIGNFINNAALTTTAQNNIALIPTCDDGTWTYYTTAANLDSIVLGIDWGLNNNTAKTNALAYINVDTNYTMQTNGTDTATVSLQRYWHVDLGTDTLANDVSIRFFYTAADTQAMVTALTADSFTNITSSWFMTPVAFDPATHVGAAAINNGDIETYTATIGSVNGLLYAELSGVAGLVSGGMYYQGVKDADISVNNVLAAKFTVSPNPATERLMISKLPTTLIGKDAVIVDIYGRIVEQVKLSAQTTININKLTPGMYQINVIGGGSAKFIKM